MPTSALDLVQTLYGAFGRGDLATILSLLDEDVQWTFHADHGTQLTGTFRGREQVTGWFGAVAQFDQVLAFEPREFIADGGKVAVLGWEKTVAAPGGGTFESDWVHLFTVVNGRITRFWGMYDSQAAARARAGA